MKHFKKKILIPVFTTALIGSLISFTHQPNIENKDKCNIKIVKIINGVKTTVDSTFDCDKGAKLLESLKRKDLSDNNIQIVTIDSMFIKGKGISEKCKKKSKIMMFKHYDNETKLEEDKDVQVNVDKETGNIVLTINGTDMEVNTENLKGNMESFYEQLQAMETNENSITKIVQSIDEEGNINTTKTIDGEEGNLSKEELKQMQDKNKMMFLDLGKNDKGTREMKHVIIVKEESTDKDNVKPVSENTVLHVDDLNFSPNPSNGRFELSFTLASNDAVNIKIIDSQGKEIYTENIEKFKGKYTNKINLKNYGTGVYFIAIEQNKKIKTSKIVVK